MKKLLERITKRGGETPEGGLPTEPGGTTETPAPKPPPELPLFFMLSHLDDDGPVRLDGVKLGVCEVMGLELDEPKLGAFTGALNALDFPAQLLIRQHAPRLEGMREKLRRPSRRTFHRRQGPPPSPSSVCSPSLRPATASSTGASTPSARRPASTIFAACLPGPVSPSIHSGTPASDVSCVSRAGRLPRRVRREEARRGRDQTPRGARRREPGALPPPGPLAPIPGPRLPPGADGGGRADGPGRPRRPDTGGAGRPAPWSGRRSASSPRSPSPSSGAAPCPPRRRSPLRTSRGSGTRSSGERSGSSMPPCPVTLHARDEARPEGDDPAGEGPLRRHPGQARQPGLPAARGAAFDPCPWP